MDVETNTVTRKPIFDATITLGHVLTLATFVVGGTAAYTSLMVSLTELRLQVEHSGGRIGRVESDMQRVRDRLRTLEMSQP